MRRSGLLLVLMTVFLLVLAPLAAQARQAAPDWCEILDFTQNLYHATFPNSFYTPGIVNWIIGHGITNDPAYALGVLPAQQAFFHLDNQFTVQPYEVQMNFRAAQSVHGIITINLTPDLPLFQNVFGIGATTAIPGPAALAISSTDQTTAAIYHPNGSADASKNLDYFYSSSDQVFLESVIVQGYGVDPFPAGSLHGDSAIPCAYATATPTTTPMPSNTPTPYMSPTPSETPTPSDTPTPTDTFTASPTPGIVHQIYFEPFDVSGLQVWSTFTRPGGGSYGSLDTGDGNPAGSSVSSSVAGVIVIFPDTITLYGVEWDYASGVDGSFGVEAWDGLMDISTTLASSAGLSSHTSGWVHQIWDAAGSPMASGVTTIDVGRAGGGTERIDNVTIYYEWDTPPDTATPSETFTPSQTLTPSNTPGGPTLTPSITRTPSRTPIVIASPTRSNTPAPTFTLPPLGTLPPPLPTRTFIPSPTRVMTGTPDLTGTPTPTPTPGGGGGNPPPVDCAGTILGPIGCILQTIGDFFSWLINTVLNFLDWLLSLIRWLIGFLSNLFTFLVNILQALFAFLQWLIEAINQLVRIIVLVLQVIINLLELFVGWLFQWVALVVRVMGAYNAAAPVPIPYLPNCVTAPLLSDVCATWYLLQYTIFGGTLGDLMLRVLTIMVDMNTVFYIIYTIRNILHKIEGVTNG